MPSPFPGMDPYLEKNPIFHELHTQMLSEAQAQLQPQLRPKYVARLERHLSEGSVWDTPAEFISLAGKEPDLTVAAAAPVPEQESMALFPAPTASATQELDADELALRKQRRIVIYVRTQPRQAVASIELLSPSNKAAGTIGQARYLEKRASALHGGLHWIEIDLLRGGQRPPLAVSLPEPADCLAYVAQATPTGWNHVVYAWGLRDPLPRVPIPLLGSDQAVLDLSECFRAAYDRIAADDEADYAELPSPPPLSADDLAWAEGILRQHGLRS
jgi:Protein of unknown function (DUF4058)